MPKDRDQLTPEEPEDAEHLESHRGQGTGGSGLDALGGLDADDPQPTLNPDTPA